MSGASVSFYSVLAAFKFNLYQFVCNQWGLTQKYVKRYIAIVIRSLTALDELVGILYLGHGAEIKIYIVSWLYILLLLVYGLHGQNMESL